MSEKEQEIITKIAAALKLLLPKLETVSITEETVLAGEQGIIDSITALGVVAWVDAAYQIDVLDGDLNMNCMATVGSLARRIQEFQVPN
jgi:acyl carrier protein